MLCQIVKVGNVKGLKIYKDFKTRICDDCTSPLNVVFRFLHPEMFPFQSSILFLKITLDRKGRISPTAFIYKCINIFKNLNENF